VRDARRPLPDAMKISPLAASASAGDAARRREAGRGLLRRDPRSLCASPAVRVRHFGPSRVVVRKDLNEWHVLAISEAICRYRRSTGLAARSFLASTRTPCLCRLAHRCRGARANGMTSCSPKHDAYTPTPAGYRHAILSYNRERYTGRRERAADGIGLRRRQSADNGLQVQPPRGDGPYSSVTAGLRRSDMS